MDSCLLNWLFSSLISKLLDGLLDGLLEGRFRIMQRRPLSLNTSIRVSFLFLDDFRRYFLCLSSSLTQVRLHPRRLLTRQLITLFNSSLQLHQALAHFPHLSQHLLHAADLQWLFRCSSHRTNASLQRLSHRLLLLDNRCRFGWRCYNSDLLRFHRWLCCVADGPLLYLLTLLQLLCLLLD